MSSVSGEFGFKSGFLQSAEKVGSNSKKIEKVVEEVLVKKEFSLPIAGYSSSSTQKNAAKPTATSLKMDPEKEAHSNIAPEHFASNVSILNFFSPEEKGIVDQLFHRWSLSSNFTFLDILANDLFSEWKRLGGSESHLRSFAIAYRTLKSVVKQPKVDFRNLHSVNDILNSQKSIKDMSDKLKGTIYNGFNSFKSTMPKELHPKLNLLLKIVPNANKCIIFSTYVLSEMKNMPDMGENDQLDKNLTKFEDVHDLFAFFSYCDPYFKPLAEKKDLHDLWKTINDLLKEERENHLKASGSLETMFHTYRNTYLVAIRKMMAKRFFKPIQYERLSENVADFFEEKSKAQKMPEELYGLIQEAYDTHLKLPVYHIIDKMNQEAFTPREFQIFVDFLSQDFPVKADLKSLMEKNLEFLKFVKSKLRKRPDLYFEFFVQMHRCFAIAQDLKSIYHPLLLNEDESCLIQECGDLLYSDSIDEEVALKETKAPSTTRAKHKKKKKNQHKNKAPQKPRACKSSLIEETSALTIQSPTLATQEEKELEPVTSLLKEKENQPDQENQIELTIRHEKDISHPQTRFEADLPPGDCKKHPATQKKQANKTKPAAPMVKSIEPKKNVALPPIQKEELLSWNSNCKDALCLLKKGGFVIARTNGSGHFQLRHPKNIHCTVPVNSRNSLSIGVIKAVNEAYRQAVELSA